MMQTVSTSPQHGTPPNQHQHQHQQYPSQQTLYSNSTSTSNAAVIPTKLYVTNFPFTSTQRQIQDLFARFGTVVECTLKKDYYAYIQYASPRGAQSALKNSSNLRIQGRKVSVQLATSKKSQSHLANANASSVSTAPNSTQLSTAKIVHVRNFPEQCSHTHIRDTFASYGEIIECQILHDSYAFVHYKTASDAKHALQSTNGLPYLDSKLLVQYSRSKFKQTVSSQTNTAKDDELYEETSSQTLANSNDDPSTLNTSEHETTHDEHDTASDHSDTYHNRTNNNNNNNNNNSKRTNNNTNNGNTQFSSSFNTNSSYLNNNNNSFNNYFNGGNSTTTNSNTNNNNSNGSFQRYVHKSPSTENSHAVSTSNSLSNSGTRTKLYVTSFPEDMDQEEMKQLFGAYGDVLECTIMWNQYAFVHFPNVEQAEKALNAIKGAQYKGCKLSVQWSTSSKYQQPKSSSVNKAEKQQQQQQQQQPTKILERSKAVVEAAPIKETAELSISDDAKSSDYWSVNGTAATTTTTTTNTSWAAIMNNADNETKTSSSSKVTPQAPPPPNKQTTAATATSTNTSSQFKISFSEIVRSSASAGSKIPLNNSNNTSTNPAITSPAPQAPVAVVATPPTPPHTVSPPKNTHQPQVQQISPKIITPIVASEPTPPAPIPVAPTPIQIAPVAKVTTEPELPAVVPIIAKPPLVITATNPIISKPIVNGVSMATTTTGPIAPPPPQQQQQQPPQPIQPIQPIHQQYNRQSAFAAISMPQPANKTGIDPYSAYNNNRMPTTNGMHQSSSSTSSTVTSQFQPNPMRPNSTGNRYNQMPYLNNGGNQLGDALMQQQQLNSLSSQFNGNFGANQFAPVISDLFEASNDYHHVHQQHQMAPPAAPQSLSNAANTFYNQNTGWSAGEYAPVAAPAPPTPTSATTPFQTAQNDAEFAMYPRGPTGYHMNHHQQQHHFHQQHQMAPPQQLPPTHHHHQPYHHAMSHVQHQHHHHGINHPMSHLAANQQQQQNGVNGTAASFNAFAANLLDFKMMSDVDLFTPNGGGLGLGNVNSNVAGSQSQSSSSAHHQQNGGVSLNYNSNYVLFPSAVGDSVSDLTQHHQHSSHNSSSAINANITAANANATQHSSSSTSNFCQIEDVLANLIR